MKKSRNPQDSLLSAGRVPIGQAVAKEIFKRDPRALHVVDMSENNMVELVQRYQKHRRLWQVANSRLLLLIAGLWNLRRLVENEGPYDDYVFNLSALKHVRSENDPIHLCV